MRQKEKRGRAELGVDYYLRGDEVNLELAEYERAGGGVGVPSLAPFCRARGRAEEEPALQALDEPLAAGLLGVGCGGDVIDEP